MDQEAIAALIKQAEAHRDSGDPALARELYNRVLAAVPGEEFATLGLGICARREGDHLGALAFHKQALAQHPRSHWPHVEMAEDYFSLNRLDEAEAAWRAALALQPDEINARRGLLRLARAQGSPMAVLAALDHLPVQDEPVLLERARILAGLGRAAEALALLRGAAAQFPHNPEFLTEASSLARQEGDLPGARAMLEDAAARDPHNPKALLKLSDIARQTHAPRQALDYLNRAKRDCAPEIWVDLCLGQVLFEMGRYAESEAVLAAAQAAYEWGQSLIAQVRAELLAKLGRVAEARALVAAALAPQPENAPLALLAAELAAQGGDAGAAARLAAGLVARRPPLEFPRWLLLQARLAEEAWRRADAAALYRQLETAQPDSRLAQEAQIRLALLAGDLPLSQEKLLRFARLEMPDRRARGLSANVSQSFWGQYHEEHAFEVDAMGQLRALAAQPAALRLARLLALAHELPDWTPAACAVLLALREAGLLERSPHTPAAIPNRIFQYWHAEQPPADIAAFMASWPAAHPGWVYQRFSDISAREWLAAHAPRALGAYQRTHDFAQKSDILRLAVLAREGGWYADADDVCTAPLTCLPASGAEFVSYQEEFSTLGNNVLGAAPGHEIITLALEGALTALERGDRDIIWLSTGPGLLTRSFLHMLAARGQGWAAALDKLAILTKPALRRSVSPHCHAGYKLTGQHWSDSQFSEAE